MVRVAGADMAIAVDHVLHVENAVADHQIVDHGGQFGARARLAGALLCNLLSLPLLRHGAVSRMVL